MFNECLEIRWKTANFASLISPSEIILFEKYYQGFDTVFNHQMKHLNFLLSISSGDETMSHSWYMYITSTHSASANAILSCKLNLRPKNITSSPLSSPVNV